MSLKSYWNSLTTTIQTLSKHVKSVQKSLLTTAVAQLPSRCIKKLQNQQEIGLPVFQRDFSEMPSTEIYIELNILSDFIIEKMLIRKKINNAGYLPQIV